MEERHQLLEYVIGISRQMAEMRNPVKLYTYVIDEVIDLVGAEQGHLVILDDHGQPTLAVSREMTEEANPLNIVDGKDEISRSILDLTLESRDSLVLGNAILDTRFAEAKSVVRHRLRSVMCVPLITQKSVVGAIYVENRSVRNRFRPDDVGPLSLFANQAAISIKNAQLYESLEVRVQERTSELEEMNQKMVLMMGQLVESKKGIEAANNLLESRVAERTRQLEHEMQRSLAHEAEKEQLFKTMTQQSEQLRHLTQLFLENQSQHQGITITIQDQIREKLLLLQKIVSLLQDIISPQFGDTPHSQVAINHLQQAHSILQNLQQQTETITTALNQVSSDQQVLQQNPLINLSTREREVFNLLVAGKSRSEIADLLIISPGTVSTYRNRIFQKLEVEDNAGLVRLAIENKLTA